MRARDEGGRLSTAKARRAIVAGLEDRREEIEGAFRLRIDSIQDSNDVPDAEYREGLRASIPKAFEYGLAAIESSKGSAPPVPAVLLTQARLAARNGVDLAVVQRRYMDCFHIFASSLAEVAERLGTKANLASEIRRNTQALFANLIDTTEEEHVRERTQPSSPEARRIDLVKAHLAGKDVDTSDLEYEFGYFHVGLVCRGAAASAAIKDLAAELDCLSLVARLDDHAIWGWLGKREKLEMDEVQALVRSGWPADVLLGIGEPHQGDQGWRLTHRQANGAFQIAIRGPNPIFRYADDPILVAIVRDEDLAAHLRETYLAPLESQRDGGASSFETLRAYFATNRNGASAAAVLDIHRQTVSYRLQGIEERLGCVLSDRAAEIEAALRLKELDPR